MTSNRRRCFLILRKTCHFQTQQRELLCLFSWVEHLLQMLWSELVPPSDLSWHAPCRFQVWACSRCRRRMFVLPATLTPESWKQDLLGRWAQGLAFAQTYSLQSVRSRLPSDAPKKLFRSQRQAACLVRHKAKGWEASFEHLLLESAPVVPSSNQKGASGFSVWVAGNFQTLCEYPYQRSYSE